MFELIADLFRADEVIRYEAALRGNANYLTSLDAPTRWSRILNWASKPGSHLSDALTTSSNVPRHRPPVPVAG